MAKVLVFYPFSMEQVHQLQRNHTRCEWIFAMGSTIKDFPPRQLEDVQAIISDHFDFSYLQLLPNLQWLHLTNPTLDITSFSHHIPLITKDLQISQRLLQYIVGWMLKILVLQVNNSISPWEATSFNPKKHILLIGNRDQARQIARKLQSIGWQCWFASVRKTFDATFSKTITVNEISSLLPRVDGLVFCNTFSRNQLLSFSSKDFNLLRQGYALVSLVGSDFADADLILDQAKSNLTAGMLIDGALQKNERQLLETEASLDLPKECLSMLYQDSRQVFHNFQRNLVRFLSDELVSH